MGIEFYITFSTDQVSPRHFDPAKGEEPMGDRGFTFLPFRAVPMY
jgi:hypothetical protein